MGFTLPLFGCIFAGAGRENMRRVEGYHASSKPLFPIPQNQGSLGREGTRFNGFFFVFPFYSLTFFFFF